MSEQRQGSFLFSKTTYITASVVGLVSTAAAFMFLKNSPTSEETRKAESVSIYRSLASLLKDFCSITNIGFYRNKAIARVFPN